MEFLYHAHFPNGYTKSEPQVRNINTLFNTLATNIRATKRRIEELRESDYANQVSISRGEIQEPDETIVDYFKKDNKYVKLLVNYISSYEELEMRSSPIYNANQE
jgi:hypothetical protein